MDAAILIMVVSLYCILLGVIQMGSDESKAREGRVLVTPTKMPFILVCTVNT